MVLGTLTYAYDAAGGRIRVGGTWARTELPDALSGATYNATNHQLTSGADHSYLRPQRQPHERRHEHLHVGYPQPPRVHRRRKRGKLQYDPLGRRTSKTINDTQTSFIYDGLNPVQEMNGPAVIATLLAGLGVDEYFTRTDSGGARYFLADALGSTVALSDAARHCCQRATPTRRSERPASTGARPATRSTTPAARTTAPG